MIGKRSLASIVTLLAVSWLAASAAEEPRRGSQSSGRIADPLWLPADRVVIDGSVRREAVPAESRSVLDLAVRSVAMAKRRGARGSTGDACFVELALVTGERGRIAELTTASDLVSEVRLALVGEIVGSRAGFFRGNLGTLYQVETGEEPADPQRPRLFFYPTAELVIDGERVCFGPGSHEGRRLESGDQVVILLQGERDIELHSVLVPHRGEVLVHAADGRAVAIDEGRVIAESFAEVRERVAERNSRRPELRRRDP